MAKQASKLPAAPLPFRVAGKEEALLFWIKLLVFFLALNIIVYGVQLAAQLSGCALPPPPGSISDKTVQVQSGPTRPVKVLAVADGRYQAVCPQWQEMIMQKIAEVSALYQHEFGIAFELVDTRPWEEPNAPTMAEELAALKRAYPVTYDYDVIIGFTAGSGLLIAGISEILGNHLLVADTPVYDTAALLAHELGHIFGARDTFAILATQLFLGPFVPPLPSDDFRASIREHKHRLFRLPHGSNSVL